MFEGLLKSKELILQKSRLVLQSKKTSDPIVPRIQELLNASEESSTDIWAVPLLLLPLITNVPQIVSKGGKRWKPSKIDVLEGFVTKVATDSDVKIAVQNHRSKLETLKRTLQPFVISVGESFVNPRAVYVSVNNILFKLNSVSEAVDATFKLIHAVHAEYPEECRDIYLIIQKGFFKKDQTFKCGEEGCSREYFCGNSFYKHLLKEHKELDRTLSCDDALNIPTVHTNLDAPCSIGISSVENDENSIDRLTTLVSSLYANPLIPRNAIKSVVSDIQVCFRQLSQTISSKVIDTISRNHGIVPNELESIFSTSISSALEPFNEINSEHKCMISFEKREL